MLVDVLLAGAAASMIDATISDVVDKLGRSAALLSHNESLTRNIEPSMAESSVAAGAAAGAAAAKPNPAMALVEEGGTSDGKGEGGHGGPPEISLPPTTRGASAGERFGAPRQGHLARALMVAEAASHEAQQPDAAKPAQPSTAGPKPTHLVSHAAAAHIGHIAHVAAATLPGKARSRAAARGLSDAAAASTSGGPPRSGACAPSGAEQATEEPGRSNDAMEC